MNKLVIASLLFFHCAAYAQYFESKDKKIQISAEPQYGFHCRKGSEQVSYTVFSGSKQLTEPSKVVEDTRSCALVQKKSHCLSGDISAKACEGGKWKDTSPEKILLLSDKDADICFSKAKKLVKKLSANGYSCPADDGAATIN